MFCPKCGAQVSEGSTFCQNCGTAIAPPAAQPPAAASQPQSQQGVTTGKTSGMAKASLVLGIIGVFITILSILAIIFGFIALGQIKREPILKGKGMAVAGLILGFIIFASWIISMFWLGFTFWWF